MEVKKKIKTALVGMYGTTLSCAIGEIDFDHEGVAEVNEETAAYLKGHFSDVYYSIEETAPTPKSGKFIRPEDDPAVAEFARNHTAGKNAEAAGAIPVVVEATQLVSETPVHEKIIPLVDATGNLIKTEIVEESKENELDLETVEMLNKLSVKDIHSTLVSAGVQDKETEKIKNKEILIPIAARKLT